VSERRTGCQLCWAFASVPTSVSYKSLPGWFNTTCTALLGWDSMDFTSFSQLLLSYSGFKNTLQNNLRLNLNMKRQVPISSICTLTKKCRVCLLKIFVLSLLLSVLKTKTLTNNSQKQNQPRTSSKSTSLYRGQIHSWWATITFQISWEKSTNATKLELPVDDQGNKRSHATFQA
jgi:hypothetical protein